LITSSPKIEDDKVEQQYPDEWPASVALEQQFLLMHKYQKDYKQYLKDTEKDVVCGILK